MALILGIGAGLFLLILFWSISIFACLVSSKLKAPLCYLGPGCISLCALISAIFFALPRRSSSGLSPNGRSLMNGDYDWTAYVVLPTYLAICLITFGLSIGLVANFYLLNQRKQIVTINSKRIHFSN